MPSLPENWYRESARENKSGRVNFSGFFLTTTSGTLDATKTDAPGFTLARSAAGRYTLQLVNSKGEAVVVSPTPNTKATTGLLDFNVTVIHAAGVAAGKARDAYIRGGVATLATAGTFIVQFHDGAATPADADVTDGASFIITFAIKRSSAVP